jgi:4'-phosphopantetheinyl transferase
VVGIYASKINLIKSDDEIGYMMLKVPQWRRDTALKFKMSGDKVRCLAAYLLFANVVAGISGCSANDIEIKRGEYGKPELLTPEGYFFNLSHSGNWVVCAIDNAPVGVDIEYIKPTDFDIAHRFFSRDEYQYITEQTQETKLDAFYETWSFKECYLKAVGMGLHKSLSSFCVCRNGGGMASVKDDKPQEHDWKLRRLFVDNDYVLAAAGVNDIGDAQLINETDLY